MDEIYPTCQEKKRWGCVCFQNEILSKKDQIRQWVREGVALPVSSFNVSYMKAPDQNSRRIEHWAWDSKAQGSTPNQ